MRAHRFRILLLASLGVAWSIACDDDSTQPSSPEPNAWIVLTSEHPFPAFEVNDMWGAATDDIHAVCGYGQILHYDGTKWSVGYAQGGIYFNDVWGIARDNIFAVGFGGGLVHFDGQEWRSQDSGTDLNLSGVWGCAPDTVYAVGWSGTVLRFDGSKWNALTPPTTADLLSIWGTDAHNIYVGARDALLHFDGETWTDVGIQVRVRVISIWGSSASDIWVTDGTNILWHYDGSTWRNIHSQLDHPFTDFWGIAPNDVFGVGDDGLVARYNGTTWSEQLLGEIFFRGVWGTSDTDVWVSGVNRVGGGALFHFDGTDWTRASSDMGILRDVWNDETGDRALAVGTNGFLVSRVDGRWESVPTTTNEHLSAVWGAPTGEAFAAGTGGVCLHFDGVAWNELHLGADVQFTNIWGAARDDVYMGSNAGLWHFDGTVWSNIGVLGYVSGVWGTGAANIFVTGNDEYFEKAYVFRFDGTTWHSIYSKESAYFAWPTGASRYDVVITSWSDSEQRSRLLGYNGSGWWKDISPPGVSRLGPVGGNARLGLVVNGHNMDGNVDVDQSLFRFDGDRWESRPSPSFAAISDGFETGVYLVGEVYIVRGSLQ